MLRFLFEIRFALIPIIILLLWHGVKLWRAHKHGQDKPLLKDAPWMAAFVSGVAIAVLSLFYLAISQPKTQGDYTPARLDNGTLINGNIQP